MDNIETAVFLAAGLGSRLKSLNNDKPKGFLEIEGKSLIQRSVEKLIDAGIKKIYFGTGHLDHVYRDFAKAYNAECIKNDKFADTGSMFTLYNMQNQINDDFLLLEADLLYDQLGLTELIEDFHSDAILASSKTNSGDEVYIEVDSLDLKSIDAELVGISKVSLDTYRKMCAIAEKLFPTNPKLDYEYVFVEISKSEPMFVKIIEDYIWCEIDDERQYKRAIEEIFPLIK
jgi:2-aminoethylphosphonate-pyruvate transaminase